MVVGRQGPVAGVAVSVTPGISETWSPRSCGCGAGNLLAQCLCAQAVPLLARITSSAVHGQPVATTVSDAEGRFVLMDVPSRAYTLRAEGSGLRGALEMPEPLEQVLLRVWPVQKIGGVVLDERGRPLAGADVIAIPMQGATFTGKSGGSGRFSLGPLPEGFYTVVAFQPGLLPAQVQHVTTLEKDLSLVLNTPRQVSGKVLQGKLPVAGAVVEVGNRAVRWSTRTGSQGLFQLDGLPVGEYVVRALGGQLLISKKINLAHGSETGLELSLEKGFEMDVVDGAAGLNRRVTGRVVRAEGIEGVAQALIRACELRDEALQLKHGCIHPTHEVQSGADGSFLLEALSFERMLLVVGHPDYQRAMQVLEPGQKSVLIRLEGSAGAIFGTVLGANGRPPKGMLVVAEGPNKYLETDWPKEDGRFEFRRLEPGSYTVWVGPQPSYPGPLVPERVSLPPRQVEVVKYGAAQVDLHGSFGGASLSIRLEPALELMRFSHVSLVKGEHPVPTDKATFFALMRKALHPSRMDWEVFFSQVEPGEYMLCVWTEFEEGYAVHWKPLRIASEGEHYLDVRVPPDPYILPRE